MAAMADELCGMLASAVVKVARDKLVTALGDPAAASMPDEKLRRQMEELKQRMEDMAELVGDAERRSTNDEEVQEWLIRLEGAAYGIWDMVDELQWKPVTVEVHHPFCGLPFATARKGTSIASRMLKAKQNLNDLLQSGLQGSLAFERDAAKGKMKQYVVDAYPATPSVADNIQDHIVGRNEDKRRVMDIILSAAVRDSSRGLFIIAIAGPGGIGKTTLANMVFSDTTTTTTVIRDYARAWVTVGHEFDLKKIGKCILSQLLSNTKGEHQDYSSSSDVESIMKRLDQLLLESGVGNKLLVVLDDLWPYDSSDLDGLRRMLQGVGKADRKVIVMVTTRRLGVARRLGACIYQISPLTLVDFRYLLKRKLGFAARSKDATLKLKHLLREIIIKTYFGGPLAIHAIGSTLRSKSLEEIRSVLNSDIWNHIENFDMSLEDRGVNIALLVTYQYMPLNLRLCFVYCAIFPRGHNIIKDDLIHHWTALQLIEPSDRLSTVQLANKYIDILLDMSFLQPTMHPLVGTRSLSAVHVHEKRRPLTMNNVVSDLARYVLGERLAVVDGRNMVTSSSSHVNSSRSSGLFAVVSNLNATLENLSSILPGAHRLLLLRFVDCSKIKISDGAFSSTKKLRLLDLRGCLDSDLLDNAWPESRTPPPTKQSLKRCSMGKLPESIGQLKHLRYLNAPAIQDRVLPLSIINGLSRSLRYLSLRCSHQLLDLTEAFGSMQSLEYLDLSGCSGLKSLPKSFGACWRSLLHLDLSGCSGLKSLPESFGACWRSLLHLDLSGCTGLKTLPQSVQKVGSSSSKLRHLDLSECSCLEGATEALSGCTDLRYLNLSHRCGYSVEDWFHLKGLDDVLPTLKELQFLGISSCLDPFCYAMPAEESSKYVNCIAMLDKLEHLDLSQNKFLRHLPENIGALKELRTLDLSMCFRLESLQGIGEVNELRALDISGCPQLNPLPEDTQQQLAKLPFLESREWLTSITGPSQASGSQEERSLIAGGNQAQDWASTSQDAARQTRMDPSSSEPEITEIPEYH